MNGYGFKLAGALAALLLTGFQTVPLNYRTCKAGR
jgi:hypothetical protein